MVKWDPTITLGTVMVIAGLVSTVIGSWYAFRQFMSIELTKMQSTLNNHADQLQDTARELREQRHAYQELIGKVQVLVGQMGMLITAQDRRQHGR